MKKPFLPALPSRRRLRAEHRRRPAHRVALAAMLAIHLAAGVPAAKAEDAAKPAEGSPAPTATDERGNGARQHEAVQPAVAERLLRANTYLEKGRAKDALEIVDELASLRRLRPVDLAQIHRFRGYILLAMNRMDDGAREFEAALAQGALDDSAAQGMMYSLAQIYTQAGKYDRARELIERWFRSAAEPKPEAWFLKAMILVQQEDYEGALVAAKAAVEKSPQPRESWLQLLAAVQFQRNDYAGVADTLRKLVALSPGTKRYWVQLATIENSLGRDESALASMGIAHVSGLLEEDKELRQRARMCFVRGLPECCARTIEDGMAAGKVTGDADSWQLLANCQIAARNLDAALEPLQHAGAMGKDGKAYALLGQIHLQKEEWKAAGEALAKAVAKSDAASRPSLQMLAGVAALGDGRLDEAEASFRAAAEDEKTRPAAESYLKHLEQKRARQQARNEGPAAAAGGAAAVAPTASGHS